MSVPFDCGEDVIDCPYLPRICEVISMLDFWCYRQKCLWQIEMSSLTESESINLLIFDVFLIVSTFHYCHVPEQQNDIPRLL